MKRTFWTGTGLLIAILAAAPLGAQSSKRSFGGAVRPNLGGNSGGTKNFQFQQPNNSQSGGLKLTPQTIGSQGAAPIRGLQPPVIQLPGKPSLKPLTPIGPITGNPNIRPLNPNTIKPLPIQPLDPVKPLPIKPLQPLNPGVIGGLPGVGPGAGGVGGGGGGNPGNGQQPDLNLPPMRVGPLPIGPIGPGFQNKPPLCRWWFDFCRPIVILHPRDYCYCHWNVVTCNYIQNGVVVENTRFYLGLTGMVLPGKGLGIETVDANSPAEAAGLKPGMVITRINGVDLTDEAAMKQVIAQSNGRLEMTVLVQADAAPQQVTVQMRLVSAVSF